jgi:hypothetical protein
MNFNKISEKRPRHYCPCLDVKVLYCMCICTGVGLWIQYNAYLIPYTLEHLYSILYYCIQYLQCDKSRVNRLYVKISSFFSTQQI